jgi:hypothetical protein
LNDIFDSTAWYETFAKLWIELLFCSLETTPILKSTNFRRLTPDHVELDASTSLQCEVAGAFLDAVVLCVDLVELQRFLLF